jgi:hypothetical protein
MVKQSPAGNGRLCCFGGRTYSVQLLKLPTVFFHIGHTMGFKRDQSPHQLQWTILKLFGITLSGVTAKGIFHQITELSITSLK